MTTGRKGLPAIALMAREPPRRAVNVMKVVDFMHDAGRIKKKPASWRDLFFPEASWIESHLRAS